MILKSLLVTIFIFMCCVSGFGQRSLAPLPCSGRDADATEPAMENCKKMELKAAEKEYQELLKNGEEAAKLSEELTSSLEKNKTLTAEDSKKLVRLEKVVKKIRSNIGAEDEGDDSDDDKPKSQVNILKDLQDKTTNLLSELKKATRYSISVVAIESSNTILKLVKILRFKG